MSKLTMELNMSKVLERWIIGVPLFMFAEMIALIFCLSVLFVFDGPSYNNLNNLGLGNVLNAVGIVGIFYVIYGYAVARLGTLLIGLAIERRRKLVLGILGAAVFAGFAASLLPKATGPAVWLWVVMIGVAAFNFVFPFILPKRVL